MIEPRVPTGVAIVTPEEMAAIDAAAPEGVAELIERAGAAVARRAVEVLGGTYGRRVCVVAGAGNNGADGRVAARRLAARGVKTSVVGLGESVDRRAELVIDAALGTGLSRPYDAPEIPSGASVLAVDIPSGFDGLTGVASGNPVRADHTVTFAALKPGLTLEPCRSAAGRITVADIGLDGRRARAHVPGSADLAALLPERRPDTHKWRSAVWVVGGSAGMSGAPALAARAAHRSGAGYVRVSVPGEVATTLAAASEAVVHPIGTDLVLGPAALRFDALVIGPGLGQRPELVESVPRLVAESIRPMVLDGDGLTLLGDRAAELLSTRTAPTVLTPHDGEYARMVGTAPAADRYGAARELAAATGAVVVLKGPTSIVADPGGAVSVEPNAPASLATAGTGDVLAGIIGAFLARGTGPYEAATLGVAIHARAALAGSVEGLVATDLAPLLPGVLAELRQ